MINEFNYEVKDLYKGDFDYVIMTNRSQGSKNLNNISDVKSCFKKIDGKDLIKVNRNGLMLSTLRKKL